MNSGRLAIPLVNGRYARAITLSLEQGDVLTSPLFPDWPSPSDETAAM